VQLVIGNMINEFFRFDLDFIELRVVLFHFL
jgi:hypothetical protein